MVVGVVVVGGCWKAVTLTIELDEEIMLGNGHSAWIEAEDLRIRFGAVAEDSRCPKNVQCVWEGRVRAIVEITHNGETRQVELVQPGLIDEEELIGEKVVARYGEYRLSFSVFPYPEAGVDIVDNDYWLWLTVSKDG